MQASGVKRASSQTFQKFRVGSFFRGFLFWNFSRILLPHFCSSFLWERVSRKIFQEKTRIYTTKIPDISAEGRFRKIFPARSFVPALIVAARILEVDSRSGDLGPQSFSDLRAKAKKDRALCSCGKS